MSIILNDQAVFIIQKLYWYHDYNLPIAGKLFDLSRIESIAEQVKFICMVLIFW